MKSILNTFGNLTPSIDFNEGYKSEWNLKKQKNKTTTQSE